MKTITLNDYQIELIKSALYAAEADYRGDALGIRRRPLEDWETVESRERVSGEIADEYKWIIEKLTNNK